MPQMLARAHRKYALHLPVELEGRSSQQSCVNGLLIEISQECARISQLERDSYQPGDAVTVRTPCGKVREGRIRWTRATSAGIRFERAMHLQELSDWIATRQQMAADAELQLAS